MRNLRKRISCSLFPLILAAAWLPGSPTASAAEDCLRIEGTSSISITNPLQYENMLVVEKNQELLLNYLLTPGGSRRTDRAPVDVMLDLDTSSSMSYSFSGGKATPTDKPRLSFLKENATALVNKLSTVKLNDQVGLVTFNNSAQLKQALTTDYSEMKKVVGWLGAQNNTNIADGLRVSREALASGKNEKKFIVLITDGDTNLPAPVAKAKSEARNEAERSASEHITIFTVAMGDGNAQVTDLSLLQDISSTTGGTTYTAHNKEQLASVFSSIASQIQAANRLSGITITQKLPGGFELTDEAKANPNYNLVGDMLSIRVDNMPYPFGVHTIPVSIPIKQTASAGNFTFEKPQINYTNACSASINGVFNSEPQVKVLVKTQDTYGNIYYGDGAGKVTRHSGVTDSMQWSIAEKSSPVKAINFRDADPNDGQMDNSIVSVEYQNGDRSEWNLTPTRPILVIKDANKHDIHDLNWHKGKGTFVLSGSRNQLPESTIYGDTSFKDESYISDYEYTIDGETWWTYSPGIELDDGVHHLLVRALTKAIGSERQAAVVHGDEERKSVKLDSTKPQVKVRQFSEPKTDDAEISITINENVSPLTSYRVELDGAEILKEAGNMGTSRSIHFFLRDKISDYPTRIGWHQMKVTAQSVGGETTVTEVPFLVNPGPIGTLETVNYTTGISNKPVKIEVDYSHPVKNGAYNKDAPTIADVQYAITDSERTPTESEWNSLTGKQFILTQRGTQTQYYVHLKIVDSMGVSSSPTYKEVQINYNQKRY